MIEKLLNFNIVDTTLNWSNKVELRFPYKKKHISLLKKKNKITQGIVKYQTIFMASLLLKEISSSFFSAKLELIDGIKLAPIETATTLGKFIKLAQTPLSSPYKLVEIEASKPFRLKSLTIIKLSITLDKGIIIDAKVIGTDSFITIFSACLFVYSSLMLKL